MPSPIAATPAMAADRRTKLRLSMSLPIWRWDYGTILRVPLQAIWSWGAERLSVGPGQIRCVEVADEPPIAHSAKHERAAVRYRRRSIADLERHHRECRRGSDLLVLRHQIQPRRRETRAIREHPEYSGDRRSAHDFVSLGGGNESRHIVGERCIHPLDIKGVECVHEIRHRRLDGWLEVRRGRATRGSRAARGHE